MEPLRLALLFVASCAIKSGGQRVLFVNGCSILRVLAVLFKLEQLRPQMDYFVASHLWTQNSEYVPNFKQSCKQFATMVRVRHDDLSAFYISMYQDKHEKIYIWICFETVYAKYRKCSEHTCVMCVLCVKRTDVISVCYARGQHRDDPARPNKSSMIYHTNPHTHTVFAINLCRPGRSENTPFGMRHTLC